MDIHSLVKNLINWKGVHIQTTQDSIEVDYNHAFELMHEAAITIETLYACVHTLDNINIERG